MPIARRRTPAPPAQLARSASWQRLARRLAEALEVLQEGHYLILAVRDRHRFVQFAGEGEDGICAECVSNHYLAKDDRLTAGQHRALKGLGWLAPRRRPMGAGSVGAKGGSPNWLRLFAPPVDAQAAAELAVRTFTEVYGVRKVEELQYHAFEATGGKVYFPGLPLPREVEAPVEEEGGETATVPDALASALQHACDEEGVTRHSPLHWTLSVDGITLQVLLEEALPIARIVAPLFPAANLEGDVLEILNDINAHRLAYGYVYQRDGEVRYATEVLLDPFTPAHVALALQLAATAARSILTDDGLDPVDDLGDHGERGPDPRHN